MGTVKRERGSTRGTAKKARPGSLLSAIVGCVLCVPCVALAGGWCDWCGQCGHVVVSGNVGTGQGYRAGGMRLFSP